MFTFSQSQISHLGTLNYLIVMPARCGGLDSSAAMRGARSAPMETTLC